MPHLGFLLAFVMLFVGLGVPVPAQDSGDDFYVDRDRPRLLLTPRRVRLLGREVERQSMRWMQLKALLGAGRPLPEPGFANALGYIASGDREAGRRAVNWALDRGDDLRQVALVFDWCHTLLTSGEKQRLAARLEKGLERLEDRGDLSSVRDTSLAAIALAGVDNQTTERRLRWVVQQWWRRQIVPALERGERVLPREDIYPLLEILHAIQDNLRIDLRRDLHQYFVSLPLYLLLSYYPAVYPAAENEYHIPVIRDGGEPDLKAAALSRAADLSLVAYDPNALNTQFIQGWSMQDRFLMRGPFGNPYEFLWANPYQPGLSYYSAPTVFYDENSGRLLARSTWDGDAVWFYHEAGVIQSFAGKIKMLDFETFREPLTIGGLVVMPMPHRTRFQVAARDDTVYYLIGLAPGVRYDIEVDDEELYEARADRGGILVMEFPAGRHAGVRLAESPGQ